MKNLPLAAAILGGILWILLTLALVGAWERGSALLTYEFLNGARPLPLALLAFALYGMYQGIRNTIGRTTRIGFFVALTGFALLALGAALEFWVGGGVRDGDADTLSLAGWFLYLAGYVVLSVGLIVFGVAFYRSRAWGDYSILPLLTGIVWAIWFPLIMVDQAIHVATSNWAQLTFGGMWIAMGVISWLQSRKRAHPETVTQKSIEPETESQKNTQPETASQKNTQPETVRQKGPQPETASPMRIQPEQRPRKKKK